MGRPVFVAGGGRCPGQPHKLPKRGETPRLRNQFSWVVGDHQHLPWVAPLDRFASGFLEVRYGSAVGIAESRFIFRRVEK